MGGTRGPSGSAGVAPPPQERAAGSAQAAPHEVPNALILPLGRVITTFTLGRLCVTRPAGWVLSTGPEDCQVTQAAPLLPARMLTSN